MSAIDDLNAATAAQNLLSGRMASLLADDAAAVAAALAARNQTSRVFYIDQVGGDDNNAGDLAHPLRTLKRAVDLTSAGQICDAYLLSDINIIAAFASSVDIRIFSSGATRSMIFDPLWWTTAPGSIFQAAILMLAGRVLQVIGTNVYVGNIPAGFAALVCDGPVLLYNNIVGVNPGCLGAIIGASNAQNSVLFIGVTINPGTPGKLFRGIASGVNPNTNWQYSTNLTSA